MTLICQNCQGTVPSESRFCGTCGQKVVPDVPEDIQHRIARLEIIVQDGIKQVSAEQRYLDVDTTERIVSRLTKWAKWFGFCVFIPLALLIAAFGLYFGHDIKGVRDVAQTIDKSIKPAINKVNLEVSQANATADGALRSSKQVAQDIGNTKLNLNRLEASIKDSQSRLDALQASVKASHNQIQQLRHEAANAILAGNTASIGQVYPSFGQHAVRTTDGGYVDSKNKQPEDIYVDFSISLRSLTPDPKLQDRAAHFMAALKNPPYHIFPPGPVFLDAISNQTHQDIAEIDQNSCIYVAHLSGPPCLLYFRTDKKDARAEIIKAARAVQPIADDHVLYVDPSKIDSLRRELLQRSGLDFVIVFDAP